MAAAGESRIDLGVSTKTMNIVSDVVLIANNVRSRSQIAS